MQHASTALLFATCAAALLGPPQRARAENFSKCSGLGQPLTEHSCFHTTNGPFVAVTAVAGRTLPGSSPDVDGVHTHYSVELPDPSGENAVSYQPARSGEWVVFVSPGEAPLIVLDPAELEVPSLFTYEEPTCPALGRGTVHNLVIGTRYRFVLGPSSTPEVSLVVELVSDFTTRIGPDRDADQFGDSREAIETACLPPEGYADNDRDCDDARPDIHPGAIELCNGDDDDCDLVADEDFGVGMSCEVGIGACAREGTIACADGGALCVATGSGTPAVEVCNGVDDDCDGVADEGGASLCEDLAAPACVALPSGTQCGCLVDSDCGARDSGRVCDSERGRCTDGCVDAPGHNGCPAPLFCTSVTPGELGSCAPNCSFDAQCAARDLVRPICLGSGAHGGCVECTRDEHCADQPDGQIACIGVNNTCAACTPEDRSRCTAFEEGAACLSDQRCGCISDLDCSLDQACDSAQNVCVPCGDWLNVDGLPSTAGSPSADGCAIIRGETTSLWVLLLLILVGMKRRGAFAFLPLLIGCGGEDTITRAACPCSQEEVCVNDRCRARCESSITCPEGQACHPEHGFCVDFGGERCRCTPELGAHLLEHACQHGALGPFEDVTAATATVSAPPLDRVQTAHRLATPADQPSYAAYRPTRQGAHAVFSGLGRDVELAQLGGEVTLEPAHRQSASCGAFDRIDLFQLESGQTYRLEIAASPRTQATLFFEHADTFADAWAMRCDAE